MALKFLANSSELLQRSCYRYGNQVIVSINIFKRKCNIKDYYLLYYYVINLSDILINELRVTSYELISLRVAFIARVSSYDLVLLHKLQVTFCIRVTNYCLLHKLRVTFYMRVTSYCLFHELRVTFIARVTNHCSLHELRVTIYCKSYELLFTYELRVTVYCTSFELLFITELQVVINCTNHELLLNYKFQ